MILEQKSRRHSQQLDCCENISTHLFEIPVAAAGLVLISGFSADCRKLNMSRGVLSVSRKRSIRTGRVVDCVSPRRRAVEMLHTALSTPENSSKFCPEAFRYPFNIRAVSQVPPFSLSA